MQGVRREIHIRTVQKVARTLKRALTHLYTEILIEIPNKLRMRATEPVLQFILRRTLQSKAGGRRFRYLGLDILALSPYLLSNREMIRGLPWWLRVHASTAGAWIQSMVGHTLCDMVKNFFLIFENFVFINPGSIPESGRSSGEGNGNLL